MGSNSDTKLEKREPQISPPSGSRIIVYGAFKGMGDLLNASPVIAAELRSGHEVKLLLFPGRALEEFVQLIDFGPGSSNLEILYLPVSGSLRDLRKFFGQMSRIDPDLVWISPHAPRGSRKIPLLLWFTKTLFWRKAQLGGAVTEHLSFLFDVRVPVSRALPLLERESLGYSMLSDRNARTSPQQVQFVTRIRKCREVSPKYDLLIHPGATAANRVWPHEHYKALIGLIPQHYRVAVLGLSEDIEPMRRVLPIDRGIEFLTGNLEEAITAIASSRVVLGMDSGTAHFAAFLDVPTAALYGPVAPDRVIAPGGSVLPIYEQKFPCQPCGRALCNQPKVYCMDGIAPETVAASLLRLLEANRALDDWMASVASGKGG